jgi:hypothetical protein
MKTKDKPAQAVDALRPYVKRAVEDPELREDLLAAGFEPAASTWTPEAERYLVTSRANRSKTSR